MRTADQQGLACQSADVARVQISFSISQLVVISRRKFEVQKKSFQTGFCAFAEIEEDKSWILA